MVLLRNHHWPEFCKPLLPLVFLLIYGCADLAAATTYFPFYQKAKSNYLAEVKASPVNMQDNRVIDSILMKTADSADFDKAFAVSWRIGLLFLEKGNHARALDIFNDMRQYLDAKSPQTARDLEKIAKLYNVIGAIYEETGLWNDAMAMYMNSLEICDKTDNQAGKAKVYNNIGNLYYARDEMNKAEELFEKAVVINKQLNIRPELFNNYNNLAGVYSNRNNLSRALEYALMAMTQLDINKDFYDLSIAYSNIGNIYQNMGSLQLALSYFQQSAGIQEKKSFQVALTRSYLSISSLYAAMHQQDSAKHYMNKAISLSATIENPSQELIVYRDAAKYFEKAGNYKKAYELYAKVIVLSDSLETLNSLTKIEQIQAVYEVINKEKDNKILQQTINLQKLAIQRQRIILAGAVAIFLFFIYFLFTQRRNNRRERQNSQMIMNQADLLHQQEKNLLLNKERSLEIELDYKNRQLTSYALHLARNNEFVFKTTGELKQILSGLNPRDKERSERIRQMIQELHQSTSGNAWEEFRLYFEEVHQSFEKNLGSAFPDLTPNDKKICALLKLGLTTKEIASITFRELRSVESARNRLRKKLGLSADVNIQSFLSQF
jgi:tetratricopeptide (TPR) repeat protein